MKTDSTFKTPLPSNKRSSVGLLVTAAREGAAKSPLDSMARAAGSPLSITILVALSLAALSGQAQPAPSRGSSSSAPASDSKANLDVAARLRDEGTNRSQMAELMIMLTDVMGPRLTGSPNCKRANEWTRDKLASWGLTNAHLEAWGPFGRGWSLKKFSAQVVEPQAFPLIAWPKGWTDGLAWPAVGEAVYLDAKTDTELDPFKGKLKGCVVLVSSPHEVPFHYEPLASRLNETELLRLANASPPKRGESRRPWGNRRRASTNAPSAVVKTNTPAPPKAAAVATNRPPVAKAVTTNTPPPAPANTNQPPKPRPIDTTERLRFAAREGAAVILTISPGGDGGTVVVNGNQVVPPTDGGTNRPRRAESNPWSTNAPAGPPQLVVAAEHYNRMVHMIQRGEKVKVAVELEVQFHQDDLMAYNTVAEIPGTDLKHELVMLGAHLDSAPAGTGAADNAAGVAVCLEAVRLIQALKLQPRRTVRIGLWTGEEQGLFGSKAYVGEHFGYYTNRSESASTPARSPKDARSDTTTTNKTTSRRTLVKQCEYDNLSAYFNLDNGAGKIRGIHLQGNEALRPAFRSWLEPFRDLGAETISASDTGGTDHICFDEVNLPGFQFIQDPIEYWRGYHSNQDLRERGPTPDLQQAAIIMAAMVYNTAICDEKLQRKPQPAEGR